MDESKTMSDQVEYEAVPESDLLDHQIFHVNKSKHEDIEPWQGGVAAEVVGLPVAAGAKTASGFVKSKITKAAIDKLADTLAQKGSVTVEAAPNTFSAKSPIPTTVGEFHAPNMVTEHGFGPGAIKNVLHNVDMDLVNELDAELKKNPVKGFERTGNSRVLSPSGTYPSAPSVIPAPVEATPMAPPAAPLNPYQKAIQKIQNIPGTETMSKVMNNPFVKGAGVVGSLYGGGENAIRFFNHMKHDQVGRQYLDALGLISNVATLAPTPFSPWSNIAGAAGSGLSEWYQRKLEEEDKQRKAVGGLATLR